MSTQSQSESGRGPISTLAAYQQKLFGGRLSWADMSDSDEENDAPADPQPVTPSPPSAPQPQPTKRHQQSASAHQPVQIKRSPAWQGAKKEDVDAPPMMKLNPSSLQGSSPSPPARTMSNTSRTASTLRVSAAATPVNPFSPPSKASLVATSTDQASKSKLKAAGGNAWKQGNPLVSAQTATSKPSTENNATEKAPVVERAQPVTPSSASSTVCNPHAPARAASVSTRASPAPTASVAPAPAAAPAPAPTKKASLPNFKTWGELTASFLANAKPVAATATPTSSNAVAAVQSVTSLPVPGLAEDDDSEDDDSEIAAVQNNSSNIVVGGGGFGSPVPSRSIVAPTPRPFDPELDSSRDGLPLLFKGMNKESKIMDENNKNNMMSVVMEEECSKSRQGTKRKEMESSTSEEVAAPVDMTALVASFKKQDEASSSSATSSSSSSSTNPTVASASTSRPIAWNGAGLVTIKKVPVPSGSGHTPSSATTTTTKEVQQPATGKKQKINDGSARHTRAQTSTHQQPPQRNKPKPSSFLDAVRGPSSNTTSSMDVESRPASPAPSTTSSNGSSTNGSTSSANNDDMDARLRQRQKQIDMGKRTVEYQNYIRLVPRRARTRQHPRTPDIHKQCSKRAMDGLVRQWRRALHEYDPEVINANADGTTTAAATAAPSTASTASRKLSMDSSSHSSRRQSRDSNASDMVEVERCEQSSEDSYVMVQ